MKGRAKRPAFFIVTLISICANRSEVELNPWVWTQLYLRGSKGNKKNAALDVPHFFINRAFEFYYMPPDIVRSSRRIVGMELECLGCGN